MVYIPYVNEVLSAAVGPIKSILSSDKAVTVVQSSVEAVSTSSSAMSLVRIAGLSGALSVLAGAYGAHGFSVDREKDKRVFQTGAYYHLIHSVALIGTTHAARPHLTATLFLAGMTMFCGSCYYVALTGDNRFSKIAPVGGMTLIVGWLSFIL
ncbi:unnamed protein product [Calicophoron daubneyi]|uniref:Transmembrane protein 256 homolog n=1 Tax=Calicophoron daubneyi TaxID=300641 RepID=A0AAV2T7V0_CALDB